MYDMVLWMHVFLYTSHTTVGIHYKEGIVITINHLLSEFQVSDHVTCMNSEYIAR